MRQGKTPSRGLIINYAWAILSLAIFVISWELVVRLEIYRFSYLPSATNVSVAAVDYLFSPKFLADSWPSGYRILTAWSLGLIIGVPVGLMIGWKALFRETVFPIVEVLRPIPPIAWIPAGILFFPSVEASVVFICFVGAFFPIVLNTIAGVKQIDETYFRAARCLGASEFQVFRDVVVRGAMPSIIVGAAVGMGLCWMALVAGEMIAGEHGLGYMIWEAYSMAQYPLIIVGMFVIGAIGALMSAGIRYAGRKLVPWQTI